MNYLVTGHTGFKGSWLVALLHSLGHTVSGIALDPEPNSLFVKGRLESKLKNDLRIDIRDKDKFSEAIVNIEPDVVIHLAAQAHVLESYREPVKTYETNVNGTLNLLTSLKNLDCVKAVLVVTTDKVYRNTGKLKMYSESDELGGKDPYSTSKAMADLLTQSWFGSFQTPPIGIARAGNVIGGGDYSINRLIPNLVESLKSNLNPVIRNPTSIRPWQHVLDCLFGYLILVDELIEKQESGIWNFGPSENVIRTVEEVTNLVISLWDKNKSWTRSKEEFANEEQFLLIDSSKSRHKLNWHEKFDFETSVQKTIDWYQLADELDPSKLLFDQISDYILL